MNDDPVEIQRKPPGSILAVDDTSESLALLVKMLTAAGYKARPADSGELALASAAVDPPDLILLDVRMKGMDGLEACRRFKAMEETRSIPVILISAFAEVKDWVEGLRMGAADYITKPFQTEELLTRVKTHLTLRRATLSLEQQAAELRRSNERLQGEIAERRRVEAGMRESEEKFRNYVERAPDGVFIVDDTGRYLEANESACRITGYSKEEIERKSIRDLLAEESLKDGLNHFHKLMETGAAASDLWHVQKDGSKLCLTVNAVKLSTVRFLGFCKDITERKQAEQTLRNAAEEREKLIQELQYALDHIKTLKGLIPICANCKKIRDDEGFWRQVEGYISAHSDAQFTHGVCPECAEKYYGEYYNRKIDDPGAKKPEPEGRP
jgi:PAS domain S-box-containing protein